MSEDRDLEERDESEVGHERDWKVEWLHTVSMRTKVFVMGVGYFSCFFVLCLVLAPTVWNQLGAVGLVAVPSSSLASHSGTSPEASEPENTLEMGTIIKGEDIWDCSSAVIIDNVHHVMWTWDNLTLHPDKDRVQRILDNRIVFDTEPMNRTQYEEWYSKLTPEQIQQFDIRPVEEIFQGPEDGGDRG